MNNNIHMFIGKFLILTIIIFLFSGCVGRVNGAKILLDDKVKGQAIESVEITYYNSQNRLDSQKITLSLTDEENIALVEDLERAIFESRGFLIKRDENYCPLTNSSHQIQVVYNNANVLNFYYCQKSNWLILSNIVEKDGHKIVQYDFIKPKAWIGQWLLDLKPEESEEE